MSTAAQLVGLSIESAACSPDDAHFAPPTWPPSEDFPIVVDAAGEVVSRYGDSVWNFTVWNGKALRLNFGDGKVRRGGRRIDKRNADLLRQICAWWLYGTNAVQTAANLSLRCDLFKPIFALCAEEGISASHLARFPKVRERIASVLMRAHANTTLFLLHELWLHRDELGFVILDGDHLRALTPLLPKHRTVQTAYIPPRIWTYQLMRLKECLDDFLEHREAVLDCYNFCLDAYAKNAGGSLRDAYKGLPQRLKPFDATNARIRKPGEGIQYHGAFALTAERFGVHGLLSKWVNNSQSSGVKAISSYLTLVSYAGIAYLLNFSLMRINEGAQLRAGCLCIERDELGDDIYLLGGITGKTLVDNDAKWITPPSAAIAVDALESIASARGRAAASDPLAKLDKLDEARPYLLTRQSEPWVSSAVRSEGRKDPQGYSELLVRFPKLFDPDEIRITGADLDLSRNMTEGLDEERYAVGRPWPFAWHQLRRTGAANMLSTGLVSESSLQYQLKHATRAMSRYYGQNYYRLHATLDGESKAVFIREMYETLAREFLGLRSDSHFSPHGEKRKAQILSTIEAKDHDALVRAGKRGDLAYRETFLGGCANPGPPCPFGGVSNVAACMGHGKEQACEWALLNRSRRPIIAALSVVLKEQLESVEAGSRRRDALEAQCESVQRALVALDE